MKVEFEDGFKIKLVAENNMERLFLIEWEKRSRVELTDSRDQDYQLIDPAFVKWEVEQK